MTDAVTIPTSAALMTLRSRFDGIRRSDGAESNPERTDLDPRDGFVELRKDGFEQSIYQAEGKNFGYLSRHLDPNGDLSRIEVAVVGALDGQTVLTSVDVERMEDGRFEADLMGSDGTGSVLVRRLSGDEAAQWARDSEQEFLSEWNVRG